MVDQTAVIALHTCIQNSEVKGFPWTKQSCVLEGYIAGLPVCCIAMSKRHMVAFGTECFSSFLAGGDLDASQGYIGTALGESCYCS